MNEKYDGMILNLKNIAQVGFNGRLRRTSKGSVTVEEDHILVPLKRRIFSDGREATVIDIRSILNEVFAYNKLLLSSKHLIEPVKTDEQRKHLEQISNLYRELERSIQGIENLKSTYKGDVDICSKLELQIENILSHLADIKRKLPDIELEQQMVAL